jgi:DNA-binding MarR family transcriptional regulator
MLVALSRVARAIDLAHSSGYLEDRSGVRIERGLHPVLVTVGELQPVRANRIAAALALKTSTVSRHVTRLVELGLLESAEDPADGRAAQIVLTKKGRTSLRSLRSAWKEIYGEALRQAGIKEPERFAAQLDEFGLALEAIVGD